MFKSIRNIFLILITIFFLHNCSKKNSDNSMFRANPQRTGVYKTKCLEELSGVKWKFETGYWIGSTPAI